MTESVVLKTAIAQGHSFPYSRQQEIAVRFGQVISHHLLFCMQDRKI
jgi:hypothetical protein